VKLPREVSSYLSRWLKEHFKLGYILTDLDGYIRKWGGELNQLGIESPAKGASIGEQFFFMEGLLPMTEPELRLPLVRTEAGYVWDVHLFKIDGGYGLVIMDVSADAQKIMTFQQKANELALLHAKPSTSRNTDTNLFTFELIQKAFAACNTAVLQVQANGEFSLISQWPGWLSWFYCETENQICHLDTDNEYSFLQNFLVEAQIFWAGEKVGCIKSGLWIELDKDHQEHLFEATAVHTSQGNLLLITKEHGNTLEKQNLIQKGRDIALDQSSLERAQHALKASRDDLEFRVWERTRELEFMNIRLTKELEHSTQLEAERREMMLHLQQVHKMEAIGTLAGGIAHDFNNILSAVLGYTELSLRDSTPGSRLQTNLQRVIAAGQRAKKLIHQILTFSRQSSPEARPVQFGLIIIEVIELLRASLPPTIDIQHDLRSDAFVMADPSQLHQVVMNICTNAIHSMQPDGGVLKLGLRDLHYYAKKPAMAPNLAAGPYIEMTITDTGHGMSEETLRRIFDPFFTTKDTGQGTGMGLSVAHGIVKKCNGDIAVISQVGQGSTFRVLLPAIKQSDMPEIMVETVLPRGKERIMVVDDESMLVDLVLKILAPLGYQVELFTDGTSALHEFTETPDRFDLILTDLYMPKMSGHVLATEIKKIRDDIPIILCSGYSDNPLDLRHTENLISDYLMKPFGMKDLAMTVRKVLDGLV